VRCFSFSPIAVGCSFQRGDLLSLGNQKTKSVSAFIPHESIVSPTSCKDTCVFTSHGPLGCLKMPQGQ
jgi:hypothetical protein